MAGFASFTSKLAQQLTTEALDELTLDEAELVTGGAESKSMSLAGAESRF